jgi:hypothetical protein
MRKDRYPSETLIDVAFYGGEKFLSFSSSDMASAQEVHPLSNLSDEFLISFLGLRAKPFAPLHM